MRKYTPPSLLFFIVVLFWCAPPGAVFSDTLLLEKPTVFPDTEENRSFIGGIVREAAFFIDKMYDGKIELTGFGLSSGEGENPADFILRIQAVNTPDSRVISLHLSEAGEQREAEPINYMGKWTTGLGSDFGRSIFYLWGSIRNFENFPTLEPPVYIDEFPMDLLPEVALPVKGLQLYPYSLAMKRNGNLIVGANSLALEMDRNFRIVDFPGKELAEGGNYTYAFGVDATPGGTVVFKPSTGNDLFILLPGAAGVARMRTGMSGAMGFAVLSDGSTVLVDSNQKTARLFQGRTRREIDVFPTRYSYITAVAAGPDGNIWIKDSMDNHIRIYSPEGGLVDSVLPLTPYQELAGTKSISVLPRGDFLMLSQTSLQKFKRNGEPLWKLSRIPGPEGGAFTTVMDAAEDPTTGLIFLTDYTGRRILKLFDASYAEQRGIDGAEEGRILEINEALADDPYDTEALEKRALYYEQAGATEAALAGWERVLEAEPSNSRAESRLTELELELLRKRAENLRGKTLELLEKLGPESARKTYSEAVQVYEQIRYKDPGDRESADNLRRLQEQFLTGEGSGRRKNGHLQVAEVKLDKLFPSLLQYYRNHPPGTLEVRNPLEEPASDIKVQVFLKDFMDFPSDSDTLPVLRPGEGAELALPIQLNRTVFSLEEDLPVQIKITLSYSIGGREEKIDRYKTVTLYRRSALSWDDSRKLAAFVTPNEEIVSQFAHRILSSLSSPDDLRLGSAFLKTLVISDGLGTYGIKYVEDPASPLSTVLENGQAVDTVRFPRTTLYYRSGDCDDSTALLCSLLESSGVETAIMTSPGHVFLAFDTGEPASNGWQFETPETEIIIHGGTVWIPLEATILSKGFYSAWESASRTVRTHGDGGGIEFLPIGDAWKRYPSLPLPESAFTVIEPLPERVAELRDASLGELKDKVYERAVRTLEDALSRTDERRKVKIYNRLGILHARFGESDKAEGSFRKAMALDPDSISAYVNLANLFLLGNDPPRALEILREGEGINSDSLMLDLLLAKTYYALGNRGKAVNYVKKVRKRSARIAESLSYIEGEDGSRASDAGGLEPVYWDGED